MPKILSANRTNVLVDGALGLKGLQEITYQSNTPYRDVDAIGSRERVGVIQGTTSVVGTMRVSSVNDSLERSHR